MVLMMGCHSGAVAAIVGVVVSTAFLVWVAGKPENPLHKLGKGIGWIAFVLTALIALCSIVMCVRMCLTDGCFWTKGCQMMGGGGTPGMGYHKMMMEKMAMPPAEEKK